MMAVILIWFTMITLWFSVDAFFLWRRLQKVHGYTSSLHRREGHLSLSDAEQEAEDDYVGAIRTACLFAVVTLVFFLAS